jgi:DNA modification methylase
MILDYSNQEDVVYDPFFGGGSTAIAAYRTRRSFLGSELSPNYVQIVEQQIATMERGCDLDESGRIKDDYFFNSSDDPDSEDYDSVLLTR